jgi:thioesterase domain-containing protein/acyl carrier protein
VILELKKIVARLLKIDIQDIADDEELQMYGFNSISFIAFVNVLNDLYRLELTPTLVFEYNSLETLSCCLIEHHRAVLEQHYRALVGAARNGHPGENLTQARPQPLLQTRFQAAVTQEAKTASESSVSKSSLVPIRSSGTRPPFFCIHPWAGMVYPYYDLADALGPDQPFYGLQAVGLYQTPHRSIEEMAAHYLEAIRTVQPAPPYLLGGWSLGGLIAFEMAQQLRQLGQDVALLALFDMPAPIANKTRSFLTFTKFMVTEVLPYTWPYVHDYFQLMASARSIDSRPARPDPEGVQAALTGRWHMVRTVAGEISSLTSPRSTARRMLRTVKACMLAGSNYVPQPYPGQATLFRVENQSAPDDEAHAMGWHKLVAQGIEVYHLPGHHFDILRKPYVQTLAGQLRACIDQVQVEYVEPT